METTSTSTNLLQGILDASPDAISVFQAVYDAGGEIADMRLAMLNEQSARTLGYSAEWAIGRSFNELAPEAIRAERYGWLARVAQTGEPLERELHTIRPNGGSPILVKVSARRFDEYVVVTYSNITERKQAEQQRQEEQQLLENIFSNLYLGIAHYEAVREGNPATGPVVDFRMKRVNDVAVQRTGYSREQMAGKLATEINPTHKSSGMFDRFVAVCTTGEPYQTEVYYPQFAGWFELSITKFGDGVIVTSNDITDRKRTEVYAQGQKDLLQAVVDNAPVGIILAEAVYGEGDQAEQIIDFRYQLTNKLNADITGHTVEAMNGRLISELFPGWQAISLFSTMVRVIEDGEPQQYTEEYDRYGISAWFEYYFSKQDKSVLMTFSDVSKLKSAELHQQRQANLLNTVVNNSPTGLVLYEAVRNESGQIIDFVHTLSNATNDTITGRPTGALMGVLLLGEYPANRTNGIFDKMVGVVETAQPVRWVMEYNVHGISGWFDMQYVKQDDGVLFTYLDVTALKELELARQQQADLLSSLLTAAPVIFAQFDAVRDPGNNQITNFRLRLVNEMGAKLMGQSVTALTGQLLTQISPTARNSDAYGEYVRVTETGVPTRIERQLGEHWFQVSLVKFGDGFISASIEITDSRRYRQQLEVVNRDLARSNSSLESFAYVASHDLQEPLRKIQSFGSLLHDQYAGRLDEAGQSYIARMQTAAGRMSVLIKDLLTYSRLTTNQEPFAPVALDQLLTEVLDDLEVAIREANATVTVADLPTVPGNRLQLRQLFQNLLSNALKFRQPGKAPVVSIRCLSVRATERPELAGAQPEQLFYEISVQDNGIGFEDKYSERIFQVFERLHGKNQYSGTGVGLSITKRVAENHGGTITAHSRPGEGATFRVYLPK